MPMILNLSKKVLDFPMVSPKRPKKSRSSVDRCLFCKLWAEWLIWQNQDMYWRTHIPLKKPEREGCVSHSHVHRLDVSFVITSVSATGFSYFLFFIVLPE